MKYAINIPNMFPKLFKLFQSLRYDLSVYLLKYNDKKKKGITA